MKKLASFLAGLFLAGMLANAQNLKVPIAPVQANPIVADAHTVILDHFDGSTLGEAKGTLSYVPSVTGLSQAIDLTSPGKYVIYSRAANLESKGTVEMWVNPKAYSKGLLNMNWNYTFSSPPNGHIFHLVLDSLGKVYLSNWGWSVSNLIHGKTVIPKNTWTHVAVSWGDSTKIYINGKLDVVSTLGLRPACNSTTYFYLPYWGDSTAVIDELHVSDIQRSNAEIASRVLTGTPDPAVSVTPGNLTNVLTTTQKNTLTNLKLSGSIDARDFKTLRDMPLLATLDLSQVSIVAYSGTEGPRTVDTYYPENTIPRNAFYLSEGKSSLTTVIQPDNLVAVGRSAYNQCFGLANINWPTNLNNIGYAAFNGCRSLTSLAFPPNLAVIDTAAFVYCTGLTSVTISAGVKDIRTNAFYGCSGLTTLQFAPNAQLSDIGVYAFGLCSKLNDFTLPGSVGTLGKVAFLGTNAEVSVPVNSNGFANVGGVLYDKNLTRLYYCPAKKTGRVDVPSSVTSIATDAFYNCGSMDSITMPASLQVIEDWAFENCTGLKSIQIPASVNQIWSFAFYNCSSLRSIYVRTPDVVNLSASDSVFNYVDKNACTLYVLSGLKSKYLAADKWKEFAHIVEISDAVTVQPGQLNLLFGASERADLKRLNLKGSIDARDFRTLRDSMPALEYLDLSAVNVVAYTGNGGTASSNVFVYEADKLPKLAFLNCGRLQTLYLPNSLKGIQYGAFIRTGLSDVTIPNGVRVLGDFAFQSMDRLEHVTLPASVDSIGYCTFTFNKSMKVFDVDAANPMFSALDGVLFDKTRKTLVAYPNLKSNCYKVPEGVEVLDTAAFEGCWNLYQVELPSTLKRICLEAFYECTGLIALELPASVTVMESYALYNCQNLTVLNARMSSPPDASNSIGIFANINRNTCLLRVPAGAKASYQSAARWNSFTNMVQDLFKQVAISPGGLYNALTPNELSSITSLKITGSMDARDFKTVRDLLPMIAELDLSGASIAAYTGWDGPLNEYHQYAANMLPPYALSFMDYNQSKSWLSKLLFPTSMTAIGYNALTNSGLRTVTLHEGITRVESWALNNCKLNSIGIPASLTEIWDNAFGSNHGLTGFTVASGNPNYKTVDGALYNKSGTALVTYPNAKSNGVQLPEGLQTIQKYAFEGCDFITWVYIPSTVTLIDQPAFYWAGNLNWLEVSPNNPNYFSKDGVVFTKDMKTLVAYPNQKSGYYDIPYGVSNIGPSAFGACWNLTGVNIPMSVNVVSNAAFYCSGLTELYLPTSITTIGNEAFQYCGNLKAINAYWYNPINLSNSTNVFDGVDKSNCVLKVPQGCTFNYRISNTWNEFGIIDELQSVTYRVKVPAGTKACFLAGQMNGWVQQPMNKESAMVFSLQTMAHMTDTYKYCSGPEWKYEELDDVGNVINNRNYTYFDTVRTWRNVYQPWVPYTPWNIGFSPSYNIGKIQFVSEQEGWIASGSDNGLLHSTDGGDSWNKVVPFAEDVAGNFSDPAVTMDWINPTKGWALKTLSLRSNDLFGSPNGAVLYGTSDGGNTWSRKIFPKTKPTIQYTDADFQGTWQLHEIMEAGFGNSQMLYSGWCRLKMTVGSDGTTTFSDSYIPNGAIEQPSMPYQLQRDGTFTLTGTDLSGFLNADKQTGFLTMTNDIGSHVFGIMQKQVPNVVYQTSDLQGMWQMLLIKVGNITQQNVDRTGWSYAIASIDVSGNAFLNMMSSNGEINSASVQFSITSDGFVSLPGMEWHGYMNADKTAFYSTFTDDGGKSYDLCVMQKQIPGKTFAIGDLEGNWRMHEIVLVDRDNIQGGGRLSTGSISINKKGLGNTGNVENKNKSDGDENVQFHINSSGIVTIDSMVAHGYLNAQKNAMLFVMSDNDHPSMVVLQKDSTYSGDMGLQVQFADENNGWASTYNWLSTQFNLYRTTNGGGDWSDVPYNGMVGFFDFVDANNGWALSMPQDSASNPSWTITHTTDGGLHWQTQYSRPANDDRSFNALQFTDLNHGWVVGNNGMMLKTEDGGAHWSTVTFTGMNESWDCKSLYFLNAQSGWVTCDVDNGGGLYVLHTTDGGNSWYPENTNLTDGSLFSLFFWDETHGWFTGETRDENSEDENYVGIIGSLKDGAISIGKPAKREDWTLYPNPVKDGFTLASLQAGSLVGIYQLNGSLVCKQRAEGTTYFDVRNLKKGMYLVRITTSQGVVTRKMLKL